jgi:hypothetical protein
MSALQYHKKFPRRRRRIYGLTVLNLLKGDLRHLPSGPTDTPRRRRWSERRSSKMGLPWLALG